ncbi:hypothetical protein GCM10009777_36760 [Microbacterium pumilum]|uniref:Uncharacterized protein n=1 Tax=Microbacterium pumilum TaxID=344165 RepID=A0ABP5EHV5_9MICO
MPELNVGIGHPPKAIVVIQGRAPDAHLTHLGDRIGFMSSPSDAGPPRMMLTHCLVSSSSGDAFQAGSEESACDVAVEGVDLEEQAEVEGRV